MELVELEYEVATDLDVALESCLPLPFATLLLRLRNDFLDPLVSSVASPRFLPLDGGVVLSILFDNNVGPPPLLLLFL